MYDTILILADTVESSEHDTEKTDSDNLACLLRMKDIIEKQRRSVTCEERPSEQLLVSEILDPRTKDLIGQARISEYVMSNAIVSAVLAMVAENRSVNAVLQELLKADGNGPRALALCHLVYPTGCRIDVPVTCGRRDVRPAVVAICPRGRVRYVLRRHCPSEEARGDSHRRHHKRYTPTILWICAPVGARALTGLAGLFVQPPSFERPQRNCRNYVRHPSSPSERNLFCVACLR